MDGGREGGREGESEAESERQRVRSQDFNPRIHVSDSDFVSFTQAVISPSYPLHSRFRYVLGNV